MENGLFRVVTKLTFGIPIKAKIAGLGYNNNHIERYNGKIKDCVKNNPALKCGACF